MKTSLFMVPAVITLASTFALADDHKKFSEVDLNKDGILSVSEARTALPGLKLEVEASATGDETMLTRDAVQRTLPEIAFEEGDERGPITEDEYDKIVEELEKAELTADATTPTATGAAASSTRPASSAERATDTEVDADANSDDDDHEVDLNRDGDDDVDVDVDLGNNADDRN